MIEAHYVYFLDDLATYGRAEARATLASAAPPEIEAFRKSADDAMAARGGRFESEAMSAILPRTEYERRCTTLGDGHIRISRWYVGP